MKGPLSVESIGEWRFPVHKDYNCFCKLCQCNNIDIDRVSQEDVSANIRNFIHFMHKKNPANILILTNVIW